jgi:hypothetical protein
MLLFLTTGAAHEEINAKANKEIHDQAGIELE